MAEGKDDADCDTAAWHRRPPSVSSPPMVPEPGMLVSERVRLVRERARGGMASVWVAHHLTLGIDVAVKFGHASAGPRAHDRLSREAQLAVRIDHPHAVRILDRGDMADGTPFIVMELLEGESLAERLDRDGPLGLDDVRRLVAQIADVLAEIHALGIVHRDIKPDNVMLLSGAGELFVKVIDFGIAKPLVSDDGMTLTVDGQLVGTPIYMAPEQLVDDRRADAGSDLWGLALVAYEALAARRPFSGRSLGALGVAMLLGRFEPISTLVPGLPPALDGWFGRALCIDPGARFGSATELAATFERASLGHAVTPEKPQVVSLRLPDKLYGREEELAVIQRAFDAAAEGRSRALLVSGYAGIGKTALVAEAHRRLTARGAAFVSTKFDQFDRGTPYGRIITGLRGLIRRLAQDSRMTHARKERVRDSMGDGASPLRDVLPEIEDLVGTQPRADAASPTDARSRFRAAIRRLVGGIASPEHPLVIFLDDLQWADLPSLDLVTSLATDPESLHVLLIAAYRDHEVDVAHPLTATLERLRAAGTSLDEMTLGPLREDAVLDLISDAFPGAAARLRLASLCHAKTHGNAFFLRRFLESLHEDGLIRYDPAERRWTSDLSMIQARPVDESVVDFVAAEIRRMPQRAADAMSVAACIGDHFELDTLAFAIGTERGVALELIRPALATELLLPEAERDSPEPEHGTSLVFRFAHDRVRQAARSLMDDATAARAHREIGRFMLEYLAGPMRERRLFELVEHLNRGVSAGTTNAERAQLLTLNLQAGRRSASSAAFEPAHAYFQHARSHLAPDAWQTDYATALAVHVEGARAAYLSGDHDTMLALVDTAASKARNVLDRVNSLEVKLHSLVSQKRFHEAVSLAIAVLGDLDVHVPDAPAAADVEAAVAATLGMLQARSSDDISRLPIADDARVVAVQRIQNDVMSSAYLAAPTLLPLLASNIVRSTLESGVCKESAYGFAVFALVLNAINLVDVAYRTGRIAIDMLDRIDDRGVRPKTLHVVAAHVSAFVEPLRDAVESDRRVFRLGLDVGDLEYAAWALHCVVCNSFYAGVELDVLGRTFARHRTILEHHQQLPALGCTLQYGQAIANLTGDVADPAKLIGAEYDEVEQMAALKALNFRGAAFITTVVGTFLRYLFRDPSGARAFADAGGAFADGATATYHLVWWHQYRALAILAGVNVESPNDVRAGLDSVAADIRQLRVWHRFSATNHEHRLHLVEGELARVSGRPDDAREHFDRAVAAASSNGFLHEEALGSELAGRLERALGNERAARAHLGEARAVYTRWGASTKAAHLTAEMSLDESG